nr:hypothetical protein [Tanacetum cinerariifolium]
MEWWKCLVKGEPEIESQKNCGVRGTLFASGTLYNSPKRPCIANQVGGGTINLFCIRFDKGSTESCENGDNYVYVPLNSKTNPEEP